MSDQGTRRLGRQGAIDGDAKTLRREPPSEPQYLALVEDDGAFGARYTPLALLGRGGMGEVTLCADRRTGRDLAIKRIDGTRHDLVRRQRFLREARIQAQLDHPTIVPVYEIGVDDAGLEYFTMKRAVGVTLEQILDALRRHDPAFVAKYSLHVRLGIFQKVCQGVEYAHSRGIIHRDLKPANIMVGEHGEVYVIDWGIAKVGNADNADGDAPIRSFRTGRGAGLGTPGYMAPEQIYEAEAVDGRADVYSLGAILFELLTLAPLHPGADVQALLEATQLATDDARVSVRNPELEVAPELERLCVLATQRRADERVSTVAALHEVIARYLEGDRDLALRRSLSEGHLAHAKAAYAHVLAGQDPTGDARRTALREAAHALALAPEERAAVELITGLMTHLPTNVPAEVELALHRQNRETDANAARKSLGVYASMLLFPLFLPLIEVRNWFVVAGAFVPLCAALIAPRLLRAKTKRGTPVALLSPLLVLLAIGATSAFSGPYLIMPGLLITFATGAMAVVPYLYQRPWLWSGACFATAVVPMVLEALGLLPAGVTIETSRIVIDVHFADVSPLVMRAALTAFILVPLAAGLVFVHRSAMRAHATHRLLMLHLWHLRQLAPTTERQP